MLLWWMWMHLKCTVKICLSPPFRSENEFSSWVSANLRSTPHFWNVSEDTGMDLWAQESEDPELTARILVVRFINPKRFVIGIKVWLFLLFLLLTNSIGHFHQLRHHIYSAHKILWKSSSFSGKEITGFFLI